MKRLFSIIFALGIVAGLFFSSPEVVACSGFALVYTLSSAKPFGLAFVSIVPAIVRDPLNGQEVPVFTRAQKALFDYLRTKGPNVTYDAVLKGQITFDPISYFIRANITSLNGQQKILNSATVKTLGVTNFYNSGYLPAFYNFCFDKIAVRYALVAAANAAVYNTAAYSSVLSSMDPALRCADLIIYQNKNTILETPIADFGSQAAITGGGVRNFDGGDLDQPRILEENKQVEIAVNLPLAMNTAANNTAMVEIMLMGVQARLNR